MQFSVPSSRFSVKAGFLGVLCLEKVGCQPGFDYVNWLVLVGGAALPKKGT
jgi:hypothetical protein